MVHKRFKFEFGHVLDGKSVMMDLNMEDLAHHHLLAPFSRGLTYEHETTAFLLRVLRPGDLFVDIGANAGYFSLLAGHRVGPAGKVVAIEANPDNARLLAHNAALNELSLDIRNMAAADTDGTLEFAVFASGDSNGNLWTPRNDGAPDMRKITVPAQRLDRMIAGVPKAIKIDTEGAEHRILAGAEDLLSRGVPFIVAEFNVPGLVAAGSSQDDLRGYMRRFGYETFLFSAKSPLPILVPPRTAISVHAVNNILFSTIDAVAEACPIVPYETALDEIAARDEKERRNEAGADRGQP